jgi:hypothetical protein
MKQTNAAALFDRITGRDRVLSEPLRWGEVPRFWKEERGQSRSGYTRDGTGHAREELVAELASLAPSAIDETSSVPTAMLTKTGFRAIAVIFEN